MFRMNCMHCAGAGHFDAVKCETCKGSGNQICEARCGEDATCFNDDGEALCGDCLMEWAAKEFGQ